MALVDYSSSSDEDPNATVEVLPVPSLKRKRDEPSPDLPPLPSKFHDLYASTTRVSTRDDPSLHGGRKRVTPHIEGNWPTHIYVEWYPSTIEYSPLTNLISSLRDKTVHEGAECRIRSFLTSDLGAPLPLHISLSRPIGFATEHKDAFVDSLQRAINFSSIRPFSISLSGLDWVANFEKTRWFLVLRTRRPELDGLNKLLHLSNRIVQEYGQPALYTSRFLQTKRKPPAKKLPYTDWDDMEDVSDSFHISIAWTLTSPNEELLKLTRTVTTDYVEKLDRIQVQIREIKSKVGNVVTSIPLPNSVIVSKGLFEG
ncbi:U6 snRNA phosphodiesterase Usb1 [Hyaloscypha variabilis]